MDLTIRMKRAVVLGLTLPALLVTAQLNAQDAPGDLTVAQMEAALPDQYKTAIVNMRAANQGARADDLVRKMYAQFAIQRDAMEKQRKNIEKRYGSLVTDAEKEIIGANIPEAEKKAFNRDLGMTSMDPSGAAQEEFWQRQKKIALSRGLSLTATAAPKGEASGSTASGKVSGQRTISEVKVFDSTETKPDWLPYSESQNATLPNNQNPFTNNTWNMAFMRKGGPQILRDSLWAGKDDRPVKWKGYLRAGNVVGSTDPSGRKTEVFAVGRYTAWNRAGEVLLDCYLNNEGFPAGPLLYLTSQGTYACFTYGVAEDDGSHGSSFTGTPDVISKRIYQRTGEILSEQVTKNGEIQGTDWNPQSIVLCERASFNPNTGTGRLEASHERSVKADAQGRITMVSVLDRGAAPATGPANNATVYEFSYKLDTHQTSPEDPVSVAFFSCILNDPAKSVRVAFKGKFAPAPRSPKVKQVIEWYTPDELKDLPSKTKVLSEWDFALNRIPKKVYYQTIGDAPVMEGLYIHYAAYANPFKQSDEYPDGKIERGRYENGKKVGDWVEYEGDVRFEGTYAEGARIGTWTKFDKGTDTKLP